MFKQRTATSMYFIYCARVILWCNSVSKLLPMSVINHIVTVRCVVIRLSVKCIKYMKLNAWIYPRICQFLSMVDLVLAPIHRKGHLWLANQIHSWLKSLSSFLLTLSWSGFQNLSNGKWESRKISWIRLVWLRLSNWCKWFCMCIFMWLFLYVCLLKSISMFRNDIVMISQQKSESIDTSSDSELKCFIQHSH